MAFEYANRMILGLALLTADRLGSEVCPLAVWDGQPGGGPGGAATTLSLWRSAGLTPTLLPPGDTERPPVDAVPVEPPPDTHEDGAIVSMLFGDAVRFSALDEAQLSRFTEHYLGRIGELVHESVHAPILTNTWGDGVFMVFGHPRDAGLFALELVEALHEANWPEKGLPEQLSIRVALHAGPAMRLTDPVTRRPNYIGSHVSRTARLEPVTPPGRVFTSRAFAALAMAGGLEEFTCEYVGQTPLAKGYGTFPTYHLQRQAT
jgi:class 3 adenylate cyclase